MLGSKSLLNLVVINGLFLILLGSVYVVDLFPQNHWALVYGLFMALTLVPRFGIDSIFGLILPILISMCFISGVFLISVKKRWAKWKISLIVLCYFFTLFIFNAIQSEW